MTDLTIVHRWPRLCCAETTQNGELIPCEKPAVAVLLEPEQDRGYPVCVHHCRVGQMVPLAELLASRDGAQ